MLPGPSSRASSVPNLQLCVLHLSAETRIEHSYSKILRTAGVEHILLLELRVLGPGASRKHGLSLHWWDKAPNKVIPWAALDPKPRCRAGPSIMDTSKPKHRQLEMNVDNKIIILKSLASRRSSSWPLPSSSHPVFLRISGEVEIGSKKPRTVQLPDCLRICLKQLKIPLR